MCDAAAAVGFRSLDASFVTLTAKAARESHGIATVSMG